MNAAKKTKRGERAMRYGFLFFLPVDSLMSMLYNETNDSKQWF